MRRWLFRLVFLAAVAGLLVTLVRRRHVGAEPAVRPAWPPLDDADARPVAAVAEEVPPSARWSDPVERACPPGFEVKVKLSSGIYHLPGMFAYDRTKADRCYATEAAAEADGLHKAKR